MSIVICSAQVLAGLTWKLVSGEYSFASEFLPSANALSANDTQRVLKAVDQYSKNPESPSLNLEPIRGKVGAQRLWTIRASQEIRILLARQGPMTVFLRAGRHDGIYLLATRTAFVAPQDGVPGLIGISSGVDEFEHHPKEDASSQLSAIDQDAPTSSKGVRKEVGESAGASILEHWTVNEIAELGFEEEEIATLRRSRSDNLLDTWPDISEEQLDLVVNCCEMSPEEWQAQELIADETLANERFRTAIIERGALAGLSDILETDELERLIKAPVEEWMVFLHPEQGSLVRRRFNGSARVRGSAGTGKTVVAIHRAAALAKRFSESHLPEQSQVLFTTRTKPEQSQILFTTYIRNLPPVFENLYMRLPSAVEGAVEFVNIHKLALRICKESGQEQRLDPKASDSAFAKACKSVVVVGTPLHQSSVTREYLKEEVEVVLKGMGVDTLDQYLEIERTGRRTPFGAAMRRQAWDLKEDYDRRLAREGIVDFADVLRTARGIAKEREEPTYGAAIVDEAQDLTLVGLQLVHALVTGADGGDRPDCLFIVGDGAQRIYPGGFTLAEAGIDVRGNSSVLKVNYRNTKQIISAAQACAGAEPVNDLGEEFKRGEADSETRRLGFEPQLVDAGDIPAQVSFVTRKIELLCEDDTLSRGDCCIVAATNALTKDVKSHLQEAGFKCQDLEKFNGMPNSNVKVGTFHRAKGLEFKVVFILGLTEGKFPSAQRPWKSDTEHAEYRTLQISQLFVAMTRARDALFLLYDTEPSDVLYSALDHCELVDAEQQG